MLAIHFDQLIFFLFIALALLFQLLSRAASKANKGGTGQRPRSTPPPLPRPQIETDQERIRKFLEALGQPPGTQPPPPVVHRTEIPPRPIAPVRPPSPYFPAAPLRPVPSQDRGERKVVVPEESVGEPGDWLGKINYPQQIPPPPVERKVFVPKTPEPATFEVHQETAPAEPAVTLKTSAEAYAMATQPIPQAPLVEADITALLRSESGLRAAIILREIFGPPRSLQPLELVGT
jgi:hypothetical protein